MPMICRAGVGIRQELPVMMSEVRRDSSAP
jgi:hypothetical protein